MPHDDTSNSLSLDGAASIVLPPTGRGSDGPGEEPRRPNYLRFQIQVLKALILRDLVSRDSSRLGFVLQIIMSLGVFGSILVIWGVRGKVIATELPFFVFLITGFPPWQAFMSTYTRLLSKTHNTEALLFFPQITKLDLIIANTVVNLFLDTVVFIILMVIACVVYSKLPDNLPGVMILYWSCVWLGAAMGLCMSPLQRLAPTVVAFLNMPLRLGMWLSGAIFSVNRLPAYFQPYLKWNPMLHAIEGIRHNWADDYQVPIYSPMYIVACGLILTLFGLALERGTRRFVGD
jgi:capsular polysaccharide transport system permease protein